MPPETTATIGPVTPSRPASAERNAIAATVRAPDGSTIYGQGSFTRTDGSSGRLADVALAYAPDISAARDQLAGAMATGAGGAAPAMPQLSAPPPTGIAPLMGINEPSLQTHAR